MGHRRGDLTTIRYSLFGAWDSEWSGKSNYTVLLYQDFQINRYLLGIFYKLRYASGNIHIKRFSTGVLLVETSVYIAKLRVSAPCLFLDHALFTRIFMYWYFTYRFFRVAWLRGKREILLSRFSRYPEIWAVERSNVRYRMIFGREPDACDLHSISHHIDSFSMISGIPVSVVRQNNSFHIHVINSVVLRYLSRTNPVYRTLFAQRVAASVLEYQFTNLLLHHGEHPGIGVFAIAPWRYTDARVGFGHLPYVGFYTDRSKAPLTVARRIELIDGTRLGASNRELSVASTRPVYAFRRYDRTYGILSASMRNRTAVHVLKDVYSYTQTVFSRLLGAYKRIHLLSRGFTELDTRSARIALLTLQLRLHTVALDRHVRQMRYFVLAILKRAMQDVCIAGVKRGLGRFGLFYRILRASVYTRRYSKRLFRRAVRCAVAKKIKRKRRYTRRRIHNILRRKKIFMHKRALSLARLSRSRRTASRCAHAHVRGRQVRPSKHRMLADPLARSRSARHIGRKSIVIGIPYRRKCKAFWIRGRKWARRRIRRRKGVRPHATRVRFRMRWAMQKRLFRLVRKRKYLLHRSARNARFRKAKRPVTLRSESRRLARHVHSLVRSLRKKGGAKRFFRARERRWQRICRRRRFRAFMRTKKYARLIARRKERRARLRRLILKRRRIRGIRRAVRARQRRLRANFRYRYVVRLARKKYKHRLIILRKRRSQWPIVRRFSAVGKKKRMWLRYQSIGAKEHRLRRLKRRKQFRRLIKMRVYKIRRINRKNFKLRFRSVRNDPDAVRDLRARSARWFRSRIRSKRQAAKRLSRRVHRLLGKYDKPKLIYEYARFRKRVRYKRARKWLSKIYSRIAYAIYPTRNNVRKGLRPLLHLGARSQILPVSHMRLVRGISAVIPLTSFLRPAITRIRALFAKVSALRQKHSFRKMYVTYAARLLPRLRRMQRRPVRRLNTSIILELRTALRVLRATLQYLSRQDFWFRELAVHLRKTIMRNVFYRIPYPIARFRILHQARRLLKRRNQFAVICNFARHRMYRTRNVFRMLKRMLRVVRRRVKANRRKRKNHVSAWLLSSRMLR